MSRGRVVRRETLYQGRVIRLIRDVWECQGRRVSRETVQHPGAAVIVPMRDRSRLVFVRQYRRAVDRALLELPAGTLEPGERPAQCARRELEEETGWRAGRLRRIGQFYAAPGVLSEQMTIFLAQDLTRVPARPDPDERLTPITLTLSTALRRIHAGTICDAKTIIGVLFAVRVLRGASGSRGK